MSQTGSPYKSPGQGSGRGYGSSGLREYSYLVEPCVGASTRFSIIAPSVWQSRLGAMPHSFTSGNLSFGDTSVGAESFELSTSWPDRYASRQDPLLSGSKVQPERMTLVIMIV